MIHCKTLSRKVKSDQDLCDLCDYPDDKTSDNHSQSLNHNNHSSDLLFSESSGIMVGNKLMRMKLYETCAFPKFM